MMKNKINENKYSLAWITSTATGAEELLSGLEDEIVQKILRGRRKKKERKEQRTVSATLGTTLNAPTFEL